MTLGTTRDAAAGRPIRLAMLGMIAGNGHPYSWSAIVNGYDPDAMARCPYAGIPLYLDAARRSGPVGIPGAAVTHVWTDDPADAPRVAAASLIPNVLARAEDAIGRVDAVLIATDDGLNHVARARPFVTAGLPVFVDKPLALTPDDLRTFQDWRERGARILSSSGMRYAPELDPFLDGRARSNGLRWLSVTTCKAWENYGIHAVEPAFRLLGPGFESVRLSGPRDCEVAHLAHRSGVQVTIPVITDGGESFGTVQLCGAGAPVTFQMTDTYTAFRRQMLSYIEFVREGASSYSFAETAEMMTILMAGLRSRAEAARRVELAEFAPVAAD